MPADGGHQGGPGAYSPCSGLSLRFQRLMTRPVGERGPVDVGTVNSSRRGRRLAAQPSRILDMARRPPLALLPLLVLLLPGACARSPNQPGPASTPPVTATAQPLPSPPVPTPLTPSVTLTAAPSPEQASAALLAAWRAGDRAGASRLAPAPAVDALFARPPAATQARGCDQGGTQIRYCVFRLGDNLVRVGVASSNGGWVVDQVQIN